MSTGDDKVSQAPFWEHFRQIQEFLGNGEQNLEAGSDETEPFERLCSIVNHVTDRLNLATDMRLISERTIDALNDQSGKIAQSIQDFSGTRELTHLNNAFDQSQRLLVTAAQLPLPPLGSLSPEDGIARLVRDFKAEVSKLRREVRSRTESFESAAEQVNAEISSIPRKLDERFEQLDKDANRRLAGLQETLDRRTEEFRSTAIGVETQMANNVARLDQAISNNNDQFIRYENDRSTSFNDAEESRQSEFQSQIDKQKATHEQLIEEQRASGQDLIDYLKDTANKAEEILGVTAASATADAYLQDSKQQERQANIWRIVVVASLILTAFAGFGTVWILEPPEGASLVQSIFYYFARATILGGLVALAFFAMRETSQHRLRERESKRLANQLTTFRPFLVELPEEERNGLVKEASRRYFPGHDNLTPPPPSR